MNELVYKTERQFQDFTVYAERVREREREREEREKERCDVVEVDREDIILHGRLVTLSH